MNVNVKVELENYVLREEGSEAIMKEKEAENENVEVEGMGTQRNMIRHSPNSYKEGCRNGQLGRRTMRHKVKEELNEKRERKDETSSEDLAGMEDDLTFC